MWKETLLSLSSIYICEKPAALSGSAIELSTCPNLLRLPIKMISLRIAIDYNNQRPNDIS